MGWVPGILAQIQPPKPASGRQYVTRAKCSEAVTIAKESRPLLHPPVGPAPPVFGEPEPDQEFVPRPAPPPLGPESPFGPVPPRGGLDPLNPHPPRDLQPRHLPTSTTTPFGAGGGFGGGPPFG
ncbi:uncharacterized protein ACA1_363750 [Acanthamoeba castellanii str. Neff]|uniref:Uncharacterized protein n=1 Tax=Acanthamoeba castellanii (strain ATCC 30010 / Neff) TaxID=1257118 RepID=L8GLC8_ACACF|nr:uncharacterized protein ACA1_363750 [Acanthamoeba castellanii str. Neff]ELR13880.1 hypothetical protein ACA1_363750 [Acanthamoeba castellanii str. Neff]